MGTVVSLHGSGFTWELWETAPSLFLTVTAGDGMTGLVRQITKGFSTVTLALALACKSQYTLTCRRWRGPGVCFVQVLPQHPLPPKFLFGYTHSF